MGGLKKQNESLTMLNVRYFFCLHPVSKTSSQVTTFLAVLADLSLSGTELEHYALSFTAIYCHSGD